MNIIIERIKEAYHLETDAEVADFLDIKPSTLSMQKNRGRLNLQKVIEKCSDVNKNWLLDGIGKKRLPDENTFGHSIPIYDSLIIKNTKPDLINSSKLGNIYTNFSDELDHFSYSGKLIGYVSPQEVWTPPLKENDIAIINLKQKPNDNTVHLLGNSKELLFRKLRKKDGRFFVKEKNGNLNSIRLGSDGHYHVIGQLVCVLQSV